MLNKHRLYFYGIIISIAVFSYFFVTPQSVAQGANIQLEVIVIPPTPTPSTTPTPAPPPGGGGTGDGGVFQPPNQTASVQFSGKAYPSAVVHVLKDGQSVGLSNADDAGNFSFDLSDISAGTYHFGFWGQDIRGRQSVLFTFQVTLTHGSTTIISGIVMPPTIEINKTSFTANENIIIFGTGAASSAIHINTDGLSQESIANAAANGDYIYHLSAGTLSEGFHSVKSKVFLLETGNESIYSHQLPFAIGNEISGTSQCNHPPDVNGDGVINLVDFSIMAFWWQRILPFDSPVDLNCDTNLTLVDFSILAFNWTG